MARFVKAPLVVARLAEGPYAYLYSGVELPSNLAEGEAERLLAEGFAIEVSDAEGGHDEEAPAGPQLEDLTVTQLRKVAAERGVDVAKGAKKDDLLAALTAPAVAGEDAAGLLAEAARLGIEVPDGVTDPADIRALIEQ